MNKWSNYEKTSKLRDLSKLEGIKHLLKKLGHPEKKFKIIHIAGTNGKGSTALIISHLLKSYGFATGCYTSPHLIDIRERIRINGRKVSKKNFVESASYVLKIAKNLNPSLHLSYFDLLTAIGFHVFMNKKLEWIVIETGLGGRYDSTNVTEKELCVLTKVGFDHQDILGTKLKDIAKEKIGITRSGIPLIISKQNNELKKWLKNILNKKKVPFYFADDFFRLKFSNLVLQKDNFSSPKFESISTSLCAMQLLFDGDFLQKKKWVKISQKVRIPGRLDLRKKIFWEKKARYFEKILIDGSHNKDSLFALNTFITKKKIIPYNLILGIASDKIVNHIKIPLTKLCLNADNIIFTPINSPRTASTNQLEKFIFDSNKIEKIMKINHVSSAEEALEICIYDSEKPIVIAGSFYLVGEVMKTLKY